MCVDLPGSASQGAGALEQRDHVAGRSDLSGFVIVSVALAPCACSRGACTPPSAAVAAGTVACALTFLVLPRRYLSFGRNQITSLAGVTFPASLS
jgi:hypothetical protein